MIYAQNTGLIDAVPSVNIGKAFEKPQKKNMLSIRPDQLARLMQTMRTASISLPTRCLLCVGFSPSLALPKPMKLDGMRPILMPTNGEFLRLE